LEEIGLGYRLSMLNTVSYMIIEIQKAISILITSIEKP
jgi:hypothetical protein